LKKMFNFLLLGLLVTGLVTISGCTDKTVEQTVGQIVNETTQIVGENINQTVGQVVNQTKQTVGENITHTVGDTINQTVGEAMNQQTEGENTKDSN
jgi:hypothetical protein